MMDNIERPLQKTAKAPLQSKASPDSVSDRLLPQILPGYSYQHLKHLFEERPLSYFNIYFPFWINTSIFIYLNLNWMEMNLINCIYFVFSLFCLYATAMCFYFSFLMYSTLDCLTTELCGMNKLALPNCANIFNWWQK